MRAACEDQLLALLRRIRLDDANTAQRFSQAAGDFRVDLAALTEEWPQLIKGEGHHAAKSSQREQRDRRQAPVQIEQHDERDRCGHQTAHELH